MALRKRRSCSTLIVEGAHCIMEVLMEGRDWQRSHNQVCPAILVSVNVLKYEVEIGTKKKSRDAPKVIYHAKTQAKDPPPLQVSSTIEPLRLSFRLGWGMLRRSRRVQIFL